MSCLSSKSITSKNIALSAVGYWPKPAPRLRVRQWFWHWLLKTLAAVLLLLLCNLVETSRLLAVKELAKTAKETLVEESINQAFPIYAP